MTLNLSRPILYLITRGETVETTTPASQEFQDILTQVSAAVNAEVELIQLREKLLTARVLFELTERAADLTRGSSTRILVNDRADVAAGAGAHGVHLTTRSLSADVIRKNFGERFLIGVSTHSLTEATSARSQGASFAVFGPVFETSSKTRYGRPAGIEALGQVSEAVKPFPILALGGISAENAVECLRAGASGIAGISLFSEASNLDATIASIRATFKSI